MDVTNIFFKWKSHNSDNQRITERIVEMASMEEEKKLLLCQQNQFFREAVCEHHRRKKKQLNSRSLYPLLASNTCSRSRYKED